MKRTASLSRKTAETDISLTVCIDGTGLAQIESGCGFLDHMLQLFARHSGMDLTLSCKGDTRVDDHHTVEDIGIVLGQALHDALGNKAGIRRYGSLILPMDEALVLCALDLSGRAYLAYDAGDIHPRVGTFDTELAEEFFQALTRTMGITLHIRTMAGRNTHHILEAIFKAFARALKEATAVDPAAGGRIPSTKGTLV